MMKRTKGALIAGTAVLAMAGVGGGIAFAANSTPTTTPSTPAPSSSAAPAAGGHKHQGHGLVGRVEHGQITVRTKTGDQVLDLQRGQVTSVSATSVTIRSQDGFTATYAVGSTSKVRVQKKASTIAEVQTGDQVAVAAPHTGNTDTIRRIADAGPAK